MASWHRGLFDSNKRSSFVQKPYIVFLFKNLNTYKPPPTHTIHKMIFSSLFIYRNIASEASLVHNKSPEFNSQSGANFIHKSKTCISGHLETKFYIEVCSWLVHTHAVIDRRAHSIPVLGSITARMGSEFHRINTNWWYRHIEIMLDLRTERRNASIQKSVRIGESNGLIVIDFGCSICISFGLRGEKSWSRICPGPWWAAKVINHTFGH